MANLGLVLLCFSFVFACIAIFIHEVRGWSLLPLAFALFVAAELFGGLARTFHI